MNKIIFVFLTLISVKSAFAADTTKATGTSTRSAVEESSDKVPVSTGKYITGGILGTAVGFGIGHGIQGRYSERGWIFTVGEAAGLAAIIAGAQSCYDSSTKTPKTSEGCTNALFSGGLIVALGFHIWEVVDVWTGARPVEDAPSVTGYILPTAQDVKFGVAYRF